MSKYVELHELIRSMSKSEKRSFKMDMQLHTKLGKNNYIALFDAVDQQSEPDEERIREQFSGTPLGRHLSSVKYQLNKQLLKCLRTRYQSPTVESRLREYQENIQLLFARGLLRTATRWVRKGLDLAQEYQLWPHALQFLHWEQRLHKVMDKSQLRPMREMLCDGRRFSQQILKEIELVSMAEELEDIKAEARGFKDPEHRKLIDDIAAHPRIQAQEQPNGFRARLNYLKIRSWIAFVHNQDALSAQELYAQILAWWQDHPHQIKLRPSAYVKDISEYIRYAIRTQQIESVPELLAGLGKIPFSLEYDRIFSMRERHNLDIMLALNFPYEKGRIALKNTVNEWLEKNKKLIDKRWLPSFYFNFACIYFLEGEFRNAARMVGKLIHLKALANRPDLRDFSRIMQIILQFEQGEYELVEYLLRNAYRYMQRQEIMLEFEKMFLEYMKRFIRKPKSPESKELLQALYEKLGQSNESADGPFPVGTFEVRFWLESKLKGVSMPELLAEKLKERPIVREVHLDE